MCDITLCEYASDIFTVFIIHVNVDQEWRNENEISHFYNRHSSASARTELMYK